MKKLNLFILLVACLLMTGCGGEDTTEDEEIDLGNVEINP